MCVYQTVFFIFSVVIFATSGAKISHNGEAWTGLKSLQPILQKALNSQPFFYNFYQLVGENEDR